MPIRTKAGFALLISVFMIFPAPQHFRSAEKVLPAFGRDTVLVWKIRNLEYSADFVVRVAEFSPDRFLEWEDEKSQGTLYMPSRDIENAKGFTSSQLFAAGVDMRGKNVTALWLSRRIFRDLKEKKKAKVVVDGVPGLTVLQGEDRLTVEVNRTPLVLPVIRVSDDRGAERWFLDQEENPLMLKHLLRNFSQTLVTISTDRPNTLRWIKGKKLDNPPQ
jgi:hypothetical protein